MSTVAEERVLVIPAAKLEALGHFQGFTPDVKRYLPALLEGDDLAYRPRGAMEADPSFKQLIPYVVFRHRTGRGVELFQYTRGGGQGEARLHAKRSSGVGGHISSDDADQDTAHDTYRVGMLRELTEEVRIGAKYTEQCVGLINDDETDVGKVHLGVVHIYDVDSPTVEPCEPDLLDAGFRPVEELTSEVDKFETWSQIVLRALFDGAAAT